MYTEFSGRSSSENLLHARSDYDEETAYESYMNPEPGFQSGPGCRRTSVFIGCEIRILGGGLRSCRGRIDRLFSKNGRMPGGAGRRTSTSFEAINASSATGIPNLVR